MKTKELIKKYLGGAQGKKNDIWKSQMMKCNKCKILFGISNYDPQSQHNACPHCKSLDVEEK
jgi:hypothetical protein